MSPDLHNATIAACAVFYPGFEKFSKRRREACISIVGKVILAAAAIVRRETIDDCARIADANASSNGTIIAGQIRTLHATSNGLGSAPSP